VQQRLQQRLRAVREREDGFTLIELLIVIVILGVLAGVVVFSVQAISDRGAKSACKTDRRTVETAAAAFYAENNVWPTAIGDLDPFLAHPLGNTNLYSFTLNDDGTTNVVIPAGSNLTPQDCGDAA
jgi:general secretion pathway protein G